MLLNTSFNQRGEPIVCTAFDAFFCFLRAKLDVLVLEDIVVERNAIPAHGLMSSHAAERMMRAESRILPTLSCELPMS